VSDKKLYLLVSEGPTDIWVIKEIAKEISNTISNNIEIRELSPQRDATSGRYPDHGWKEVRNWCKLYGNSTESTGDAIMDFAAKRKNWRAEIALSRADALIIQIDTDIVQFITDIIPMYSGTTKVERKGFVRNAILKWLDEDNVPQELFLLLSTYSTETWVLATHQRIEEVFNDLPSDFDFEDIENVLERLFTLEYESYIDPNSGNQKLTKNKYKNYAKKISENLEKVRSECEEAEKLCSAFEA